jgi:hypothetical protein
MKKRGFMARHSMTIVTLAILTLWIALYRGSNSGGHAGAFFGNAIADWTGLLAMVLGTKYLYEAGSAESRQPPPDHLGRVLHALRRHSLTIVLVVTGVLWAVLYWRMDPGGKWGQVVGNIVSEWTQVLGVVLMTKRLVERGSKESAR